MNLCFPQDTLHLPGTNWVGQVVGLGELLSHVSNNKREMCVTSLAMCLQELFAIAMIVVSRLSVIVVVSWLEIKDSTM